MVPLKHGSRAASDLYHYSTHLGNSLAAYPTSDRHALEFNVDVICRHPTTP